MRCDMGKGIGMEGHEGDLENRLGRSESNETTG